jgi:hypothetical protein
LQRRNSTNFIRSNTLSSLLKHSSLGRFVGWVARTRIGRFATSCFERRDGLQGEFDGCVVDESAYHRHKVALLSGSQKRIVNDAEMLSQRMEGLRARLLAACATVPAATTTTTFATSTATPTATGNSHTTTASALVAGEDADGGEVDVGVGEASAGDEAAVVASLNAAATSQRERARLSRNSVLGE